MRLKEREVVCLVMLSETKDLRLYEKASRAIGSEPSQHAADHGERDPSLFAALEQFVILSQTPPGSQPSKRAFHHPTPRQQVEAPGLARRLLGAVCRSPDPPLATGGVGHNFDLAAQLGVDPCGKAEALVGAIGPDER